MQPNFTTDGIINFIAQQKQRKQIILTDDKNIFTNCFQPIQRLQPNLKIDDIRNFICTKRNGDNEKLRIFSFLPQRQRTQHNFMNHTYQTNKHNPNNQTKDIDVGFTLNTKFMLLQLRQRKFWSILIQISQ